ncbi:major facilitator superfamily domain-containing protein [Aspergillus unguis]
MDQKPAVFRSATDSPRCKNGSTNDLSEDEKRIEKKLVRKLDFLILPLITMAFFLNVIDRTNYGSARLQGLERDLHMSDSQFQAGLSVFYIGYILFQIPANMLLNHFGRPAWHIGLSFLAWGSITSCTASVSSFGGLVTCRILLGCAEAPMFPGMMFYLSKWYKRTELSLRISIFLSSGLIATATGSLIAAGISDGLDGAQGLSAWRWLYLIEGMISICGSFVIVTFLPDFPQTWVALTPAMKDIAIRRLALEFSKSDVDEAGMTQVEGLRLALRDKKLYLLTLMNFGVTVGMSSQNFFPTMTATLGYSNIIALLLVAPPYIFAAIHCCTHSYISDRTGRRFWYMIYPSPLVIAGFVIYMSPVTTFGVRYFSMFLMLCIYSMNMTIMAWMATTISRPPAKRAAAYGFISMMTNGCSVWTPFTYRDQDSPYFRPALGLSAGLIVVSVAAAVWLRIILVKENRRLDEVDGRKCPSGTGSEGEPVQARQFFRYTI